MKKEATAIESVWRELVGGDEMMSIRNINDSSAPSLSS